MNKQNKKQMAELVQNVTKMGRDWVLRVPTHVVGPKNMVPGLQNPWKRPVVDKPYVGFENPGLPGLMHWGDSLD